MMIGTVRRGPQAWHYWLWWWLRIWEPVFCFTAAARSGARDMPSISQGSNATAARLAPLVRVNDSRSMAPEKGAPVRFQISDLNFFYGPKQAVFGLNLNIPVNKVTALIGPSGCGKSTFLRTLNRMNEIIRNTRVEGNILLDGQDIRSMDVVNLRRRVGMVFQKPNPFPKSIYENVAYGPRIHGLARGRADLDDIVCTSLQRAGLWDEVKDRLNSPGTGLSGGQQQRLCIARTIAIQPEGILMDEPCSALDPIATARIEDLIDELRAQYAIVIVTHSMQQAARVSQRTAYFHMGDLIEVGETDKVFTNPRHRLTEDYITGRFG